MEKKDRTISLLICLIFLLGLIVGYAFPRDVHTQVIEASERYIAYHQGMQTYLYPFNETDNVTVLLHGNKIVINHTVPNELGIRFFNIGFDNDGFFTYVTQLRTREK